MLFGPAPGARPGPAPGWTTDPLAHPGHSSRSSTREGTRSGVWCGGAFVAARGLARGRCEHPPACPITRSATSTVARPPHTPCSANRGQLAANNHGLTLGPCAVLHALLEWASLRGPDALLNSSLPPLLRAMRRDVQRWTVPRPRHCLESFAEWVETLGQGAAASWADSGRQSDGSTRIVDSKRSSTETFVLASDNNSESQTVAKQK